MKMSLSAENITQRLAIDSSISLANFPGKLRIKQTLLGEVDVTHTLKNLHVLPPFSPSCSASLSLKIVRNMLHHRFYLTWHFFLRKCLLFVWGVQKQQILCYWVVLNSLLEIFAGDLLPAGSEQPAKLWRSSVIQNKWGTPLSPFLM